ncbi:hypothetical protein GGI59_006555 [Rhizobium lentis]|uniref:Uncharacterized protein n=1 Tax=Rhizobium lentis TaxID=1138194 RepID=A0A7W8XL07_9HYPH|nr:hypothetical protein [Rhizobium lentis]MBB5554226.1 hypothetical protein [Rhizobium lentis]MBB5564843.1 hypothetical protein [Rhizobium lentis]MBB5571354.1 hypothetical protein [Rhizobium lentis]
MARDDHTIPRIARTNAATRSTGTSPGTRTTRSEPISNVTIPELASIASAIGKASAGRRGSVVIAKGTKAGSNGSLFSQSKAGTSSAGNVNDPRTRLKALCYNSRLQIIRPPPVSTTGLDNLEAPNKPLIIRHAKSPALAGAVLARTSMLRNIRIQWDGGGAYTNAGSNARTSPDLPDQQNPLAGRLRTEGNHAV